MDKTDRGRVLTFEDEEHQNQYADGDVLLARHDAKTISPIFSVVNKPVRLVAFGSNYQEILVSRLWFPASALELKECTGEVIGYEPLEIPLRYGGQAVRLTEEQPEIVLDMRGDYRVHFVAKPDDELARETVQVVKILEPLMQMSDVARGYYPR